MTAAPNLDHTKSRDWQALHQDTKEKLVLGAVLTSVGNIALEKGVRPHLAETVGAEMLGALYKDILATVGVTADSSQDAISTANAISRVGSIDGGQRFPDVAATAKKIENIYNAAIQGASEKGLSGRGNPGS